MHIVPEKKAIVVKVRDPGRITTVIPRAKTFTVNGNTLVGIPHRIEEVRVLRNLGIHAPSPILNYYNWPRDKGLEPFDAQYKTAAFLTLFNRAFCLNSLGTGKTLAALWAFDYLRTAGLAKAALAIGPLSTLDPTWAETIETHLPHLRTVVLYGPRAKRAKLLQQPADVYIINHDGVAVILDDLSKRRDITHVIVDEVAQVARNQKTERWRVLNTLINSKDTMRAAWGLTGTPTPNAPTDAYAQAKLITPETAPPYFSRFRDQVMYQAGMYAWLPRADANERVFNLLQPAIRFTREECIDLPETTYVTRHVPLTNEQQRAYVKMRDLFVAEAAQGQILAVNEGVKVSKLVQICSGAAYATDGSIATLDVRPRVAETVELIREAPGKALVFVPFISALQNVAQALRDEGFDVAMVYGDVSKRDRDMAFGGFQHQSNPQVLVCQPAAMSHGLTLTRASTIIWFAPVASAETYEQANGRITRPGQKHNTLIVHIEGSEIERRIYKRLQHKQKMQGVLLDMIQANRE